MKKIIIGYWSGGKQNGPSKTLDPSGSKYCSYINGEIDLSILTEVEAIGKIKSDLKKFKELFLKTEKEIRKLIL